MQQTASKLSLPGPDPIMLTGTLHPSGVEFGVGPRRNGCSSLYNNMSSVQRSSSFSSSSERLSTKQQMLQDYLPEAPHFSQTNHGDQPMSGPSKWMKDLEDSSSLKDMLEMVDPHIKERSEPNGCSSEVDDGRITVESSNVQITVESYNMQDSYIGSHPYNSTIESIPGIKTMNVKKRLRERMQQRQAVRAEWEGKTLEEAMFSVEKLLIEPLPTEIFIPILKKCRRQKSLSKAKRLHLHMCCHGFEGHGVLKNFLITIFVDSGCVAEAQQLFNRSVHVDEHCWNTLVQGYLESGDLDKAFDLYEEMQEQALHVRRYILMSVLKAVSSSGCLNKGQILHAKIVKEGLEKDRFFCNTLMDMYIKCDVIKEAQEVFYEQPLKDTVLWSTLINGFAEHKLFEEVLNCWNEMLSEGVNPDSQVFVHSLSAVASLRYLDKGYKIHTKIVEQMLDKELILGNAMVDMYAKCGSLKDSHAVFDNISKRDVVSWTSLISGYADHDLGEKALEILEAMKQSGIVPNDVTFLCSLKACGRIGSTDEGKKIHAYIVSEGYEDLPLVSNALVDMYSKCGLFAEAGCIFNELPVKNVVSWTSLIEGYAKYGLGKKAIKCFKRMQTQGVSPNVVTYLCVLKACRSAGMLDNGMELHTNIIVNGFETNLLICGTLVDMYAEHGFFEEAKVVFDRLEARNTVTWSALIAGYAKHGYHDEVIDCIQRMHSEGVCVDDITYSYALQAYGDNEDVCNGEEMYSEIICKGMEESSHITTAVLYMYGTNGALHETRDLFLKSNDQSLSLWNLLIRALAEQGFCEEASDRIEQMQLHGVVPDEDTWMYSLKACHCSAFCEIGRTLHSQIVKLGVEGNASAGRALLDMYAMHGSFTDAWKVFDSLPSHNSKSWTSIISRIC